MCIRTRKIVRSRNKATAIRERKITRIANGTTGTPSEFSLRSIDECPRPSHPRDGKVVDRKEA